MKNAQKGQSGMINCTIALRNSDLSLDVLCQRNYLAGIRSS